MFNIYENNSILQAAIMGIIIIYYFQNIYINIIVMNNIVNTTIMLITNPCKQYLWWD